MIPGADGLIAVAAVVVALTVIVAALVKLYRVAHRIDAALGVDKDGRTIADRLSRVEHQLWPNGGTSLADSVGRLETGQARIEGELSVVRQMLAERR